MNNPIQVTLPWTQQVTMHYRDKFRLTTITKFIKAKLKKSDDHTNIDK